MNKRLLLLVITVIFFFSTSRLVRADIVGTCGYEYLCPAPVGECVAGGPWEVGHFLITQSQTVYRCAKSNSSCSVADVGRKCSFYDIDDPYAPPDDYCEQIKEETPFCDSTWWTACCTPEPIVTGTPTSGDGGGDPTPTTTPVTTYTIGGRIQQDIDAGVSGVYCSQSTPSPLVLTGFDLSLINSVSPSTVYPVITMNNQYLFTTSTTGNTFTITLDLSGQVDTNYICSCPAPLDPDNPYLCRYTGVEAPTDYVNFYLKDHNLSNESWFQVFGGNLFGQTGIASIIPYNLCSSTNSCDPALITTNSLSANPLSSGFPIANTGNGNTVKSYDSSTIYHSYFHLPTRNTNVNSYDVNTDLNQLSYDYFYKLAENSVQTVGDGTSLKPNLSTWTSSAWWVSDDVNYIKVNGDLNIDETQGFNLSSSQQLVVLVDGNLTLDDSNPGDTNRKITSVTTGGFLAFIVNGDITITSDVGYALNPAAPTTPAVSNANSNVEGVFIAHHNLIIQSKTAGGGTPPDRKFVGAGTFVAWNNVELNRTFDDGDMGPILNNSQAIENFVYRPDLLANWPVKLKASISNWREVDPQYIGQ